MDIGLLIYGNLTGINYKGILKMASKFKFLDDFAKEVAKMEGVSTSSEPPRYWHSFGNHAINRIMSGSFYRGVPQGRITALCGPASAGKSFLAANLVLNTQQMEEDSITYIIDSENALDKVFMAGIGADVFRDGYFYASPDTIPQTAKLVSKFIAGYKAQYGAAEDAPRVLIVVDSLDMLMTDAEKKAADSGDMQFDQGQHSRMLKSLLRSWVQDIKTLNISIVVTKQVYRARQDQLLQGEGAWVINDAIRYACSQILLATRLKLKGEKSTPSATTAEIIGIRLKAEGFKTRFCSPFSNVVVDVPYDEGMSKYSGMFDIAVAMGVITKKGSWYNLAGDDANYRGDDIKASPEIMDMVVAQCEKLAMKRVDIMAALGADVVEDTTNQPTRRGSKGAE
jgi:RecA/RadA recombinase